MGPLATTDHAWWVPLSLKGMALLIHSGGMTDTHVGGGTLVCLQLSGYTTLGPRVGGLNLISDLISND